MGFGLSPFKKNYISFLIRKTQESYQRLSEDCVVGFAVYQSEKERKKPGILRRKGERIKNIALVFYPVLLGSYRDGSAVLIDPLKKSKFTIAFNVLDKSVVDAALSELALSSGKSFLDAMVKIDKLVGEIASGKKNVFREVIELENVISDTSFIKDLKLFVDYIMPYSIPFAELPWVGADHVAISEKIKRALKEIDYLISYVSSVLGKVSELLSNWKKSIQGEYEGKITALDQKIRETREIVLKNIEELRKKKEEELAGVGERYLPHIDAIKSRISETQEGIKKIEDEIERAKSYGKDVSDLKKKLNELKKTLESLEEELNEERTKYENELKKVEKKFEELIEAENNKVKSLVKEKEALQHELESLVREAERRSDSIRGSLQEYREGLIKAEKEIEGISISIPSSGEGLYMIPIVYTVYASDGSTRSILTTPVVLEPGGWLSPKLNPVIAEGLRNYISWSKELIEKEDMKSELEAKNLLSNISLERIEVSLTRLAEIGFLSREEVKEIVGSIEEQKKIS